MSDLRAADRLRILIETDAGGDPDDEQSLVRFLLYANEWDIEGIIANRPHARVGENANPERTGPGIVRRMVRAYGQCWTNLARHDPRYPPPEHLLARTVAGHDDTQDAVNLILATIDRPDSRPVWYSDWGTDHGAATNNLRRTLDQVLRERGAAGYAAFKRRLRLASADAFAEHMASEGPPFPIWVDTFRPELEGRRWYHRFSGITATAGGFDIERDVRQNHGPLGALYPLNTTHPQKEGDTMTFLYLVPTGMNDPEHPTWGSWGGRYGPNTNFPGKPYFGANQADNWRGTTHRDNVLARWAVALQNDFRARMNWCVAREFKDANHPPIAVLNGDRTKRILELRAGPGEVVTLSAAGTGDPDGHELTMTWTVYGEAGTCEREVELTAAAGNETSFVIPAVTRAGTIHLLLEVEDSGMPRLSAYRRAIITAEP